MQKAGGANAIDPDILRQHDDGKSSLPEVGYKVYISYRLCTARRGKIKRIAHLVERHAVGVILRGFEVVVVACDPSPADADLVIDNIVGKNVQRQSAERQNAAQHYQ